MPELVHSIRIIFGAQTQPSITIQQSDYNSRKIQAACFTSSGQPMDFSGATVTVVYNAGADPTKEYPVTVNGNVLSFTMPGLAAQTAGSWSMQIFIYWAGSLLHSAEIPYTVLKTITPGTGGDDPVPELVLLIQQAQEAIAGANEAASTANQAAGSANSAANSANEKAGIAASAANSAKEAASNAATMASLAQTATANANSAANSARNAAESANQAAASVNAAAASASQVAADVQQKADSGAFNGKNGLDAPQINDTQITTTNPWSSMQIVNTLCPPFKETGNPVVCYPVASYPLGVKVAWEPRQEGEGNPSPENVRPIVGLDSVQVTRCGKNFMPYSKPSPSTYTENGITFTWNDDGSIHVSGTAVGRVDSNVMYFEDFHLPPGKYRMISSIQPGVVPQFVVKKGNTGTKFWYSMNVSIENGDVPQYFYVIVNDGATVDTTIYAFLSYGIENPTDDDYAPYTGTTATLTLPETIYGGTVDVGTGAGSEEWSSVIELSSSNNLGILEDYANETTMLYYIYNIDNMQNGMLVCCSHLPTTNIINSSNTNIGIYGNPDGDMAYIRLLKETASNLDQFKQWVDAQSAAGTPVTITYKLATPQPIQATGGQSIPALSGTNTLYADAGDITVTGASDPIATITALQTRVSALENAQTNM